MMTLLRLLLALTCLLLYSGVAALDCPVYCNCNKTTHEAKCQNKNLTFIPAFEKYITSLTFTGNNLKAVRKKTFQNLTSLNIEILILRHNNICYLYHAALSSLRHLRHLDLSGNGLLPVDQLASSLSRLGSPNINVINLNSFGWSNEPTAIYEALSSFNITEFSMSRNNIKSLNLSDIGEHLPYLTYFNVAYNNIQTITTGKLSHLVEFAAHHNYIDVSRDLFENDGQCNFPSLKILNLTSNFVNYFENRFTCLNSLELLVLDRNPVKQIRNNTFVNLTSIRILSLNHLGDRLFNIEGGAFRSNSLKTLWFSKNHFVFTSNVRYIYFDPDNIFAGIPSLEELDLSENYFNISDGILERMLSNLTSLKRLTIKSSKFRTIPTIINKMRKLEMLNLTKNHISSWNGTEVFGNITSLTVLRLDYNYINVFNDSSFPESLMLNMRTMNLAGNPFFCSCKNLWFRRWIKTRIEKRPDIFTDYPKNYICINPPEREGTKLKDYFPSNEECDPSTRNTFINVVTAFSVTGISVVLVVSVLYKGRWHIRYWIYLHRSKRSGYIPLRTGEDIVYSGFVVYCDEDRSWVFSKFLKVVEEENGQRLCIHHRDFEVGKLIVDNIAESIAQSKKVILVMSKAMIRSDWCLFETRLAQRKFLNDESGSLIIVMLDNIKKKDLPYSLRSLVDMTTYITWSEDPGLQDRFWNMVIKAMKEPII